MLTAKRKINKDRCLPPIEHAQTNVVDRNKYDVYSKIKIILYAYRVGFFFYIFDESYQPDYQIDIIQMIFNGNYRNRNISEFYELDISLGSLKIAALETEVWFDTILCIT